MLLDTSDTTANLQPDTTAPPETGPYTRPVYIRSGEACIVKLDVLDMLERVCRWKLRRALRRL